MAKMMKRLIAMAITVSMFTSVIAMPISAAEEESPNSTVTVEIKNENGDVIGTMTSTTDTKVEETDSTYSESTKTDSEWNTSDTTENIGDPQQTDENTTQQTDVTTTVEKNGEETTEDKVTVDGDGNITETGSTVGSETTETTITTDTTTTTEGAELEEPKVEGPTTTEEDKVEFGEEGDLISDGSSDWTPDTDKDEEGKWEAVDGTASETEGEKKDQHLVGDALSNGDVKLEMTAPGEGETETTDSEKVVIKLEDVIPEAKEGETVEAIKDDAGNIIGYKIIKYSDAKANEDNSDAIVEDTASGEGPKKDGEATVEVDVEYLKPQGYQEGTKEGTNEDGSTYTEKTESLEDGTGFKVTTTVIQNEASDAVIAPESTPGTDKFVNTPVIPEDAVWQSEDKTSYIQLPKKPEASESTDANGVKTVVSVEELKDELSGSVIGYKKTVTVTDAEGKLLSRESESQYGTITKFNTTVTKDPETKQTITVTEATVKGLKSVQKYIETVMGYQEESFTRVGEEDAYQLIDTAEGLVFWYNGKMYKVENNSTLEENRDILDSSKIDTTKAEDDDLRWQGDKVAYNDNGTLNSIEGYYSAQEFGSFNGNYKNWTFVGYGLFSDFAAEKTDGETHRTSQFAVKKDGEVRYLYCVEVGVHLDNRDTFGDPYIADQVGQNSENISWKGNSDKTVAASGTIGQLRSVCLNGFWGTEEGLGSLEAVKDLMRREAEAMERAAKTDAEKAEAQKMREYADKLTAGMALTATQVAIWEFGASEAGGFGGEDYNFVKQYVGYKNNGSTNKYKEADASDAEIIVALRDLLVDLAKDPDGEGLSEVIDEKSITDSSITLTSKATNEDGTAKKENGKNVYNGNLGFTLDVSTSSINGDLKLVVKQGNKTVGTYRLAGDDKTDLTDIIYKKIYPDANGTYILEDVELIEGVKIDLALTGTQHLDDGIYVFNDAVGGKNKQDLVGLSTLEQDVNLTFSMEFNVVDPALEHTEKTWEESKTDKNAFTKDKYYHSDTYGTNTTKQVTVTTKLLGTVTQVDSTTQSTIQLKDWETYYSNYIPGEGGGHPGVFTMGHGPIPGDDVVILDEEVPLAAAPKTGDFTAALVLISLCSACGLIVINRKRGMI